MIKYFVDFFGEDADMILGSVDYDKKRVEYNFVYPHPNVHTYVVKKYYQPFVEGLESQAEDGMAHICDTKEQAWETVKRLIDEEKDNERMRLEGKYAHIVSMAEQFVAAPKGFTSTSAQ